VPQDRRVYTLLGADGRRYESATPGALGGNARLRIYGRLDCGSARAALPRGYAQHRVFFADEATAIAAGYRPCGNCMRAGYREWRSRRAGTA
jgi:methylphosphotriester-DNA--protein-cysteine methyltransferase